mgnify:CR=1 FL=1
MDLEIIRNKLIELRQAGHTYFDIADVVGLTHPTIIRFLQSDKGLMFNTVSKLQRYVDGEAESELIERTLTKRSKGLK